MIFPLNGSILVVSLTSFGSLFQRKGAAAEKARSPYVIVLVVFGSRRYVFMFLVVTVDVLASSSRSSDRYDGASPCRALNVSRRIL